MKKILSLGVITLLTSTLYIEANDMSMDSITNSALKVGTLGIGFDVSRMVTEQIAIRGNINGFSYNRASDLSNITYNATLNLLTIGALADYYPYENNFRFTGGVYYNNNKLDGVVTPAVTESIKVGDKTYTGANIGKLQTGINFNHVAPYIGLGWGNKSTTSSGWGFTLDIGALYQGSPKVSANATINSTTPKILKDEITTNVEKERQQIESDVSKYTWYPVIMIGINYNF